MIDFLWAMGPYLLPLVILSIYSVGLILHKWGSLRLARPVRSNTFVVILDEVSRGHRTIAGLKANHPLAYLLSHASEPPTLRQARAQALLSRWEDRLSYLPALANIATLTGLFGTVCGMIVAFLALRTGGGADPSSLAGGLGQALVATALGLVTAIPALMAHAVFQKRIQAMASQLEGLLSALLIDAPGEPRP